MGIVITIMMMNLHNDVIRNQQRQNDMRDQQQRQNVNGFY